MQAIPKVLTVFIAALFLGPTATIAEETPRLDFRCPPTAQYDTGPFYRAGAPVRGRIGTGYLLTGVVRSAIDCRPVAAAKIELWTTGPDGSYQDRWRATTFSDRKGRYRFETHFPGRYGTRPPHIHIVASAPGFATLATQQFPAAGENRGTFDLVLSPGGKPVSER